MYPDHTDFSLASLQTKVEDFQSLNEELKQLDNNPEQYWYAMGSRLRKILEERLYRAGGYRSFSHYCQRGIGYSRQHIYKLMKVAQFIDEKSVQSQTVEQKAMIRRLFNCGFTKLYLIHGLPESKLVQLLNEGITESVNDFSERRLSVETATIGQLKRAFKNNAPTRKTTSSLLPLPTWTSLIKSQLQAIAQLISQCQQNLNSKEQVAENLGIIAEYSHTILDAVNALNNERPLAHSKSNTGN